MWKNVNLSIFNTECEKAQRLRKQKNINRLSPIWVFDIRQILCGYWRMQGSCRLSHLIVSLVACREFTHCVWPRSLFRGNHLKNKTHWVILYSQTRDLVQRGNVVYVDSTASSSQRSPVVYELYWISPASLFLCFLPLFSFSGPEITSEFKGVAPNVLFIAFRYRWIKVSSVPLVHRLLPGLKCSDPTLRPCCSPPPSIFHRGRRGR